MFLFFQNPSHIVIRWWLNFFFYFCGPFPLLSSGGCDYNPLLPHLCDDLQLGLRQLRVLPCSLQKQYGGKNINKTACPKEIRYDFWGGEKSEQVAQIECLNRCWILREEENQTCTIEKKIMIKIKEVSFQENPACTKGDVSSNLRVGGT